MGLFSRVCAELLMMCDRKCKFSAHFVRGSLTSVWRAFRKYEQAWARKYAELN